MITFEQAQRHIFNLPFRLVSEDISILDAHQRILSTDIVAQSDLPAWNNSAMDGYALHIEDLHTNPTLPISQVIPAGATSLQPLQRGTCARIFTGAPVPIGANAVVMQENTTLEDEQVRILTNPPLWKNIRKQGEEVSKDSILLKRGSVMDATNIPLAISAGVQSISVWKWPKIGIIATGDELVQPTSSPARTSLELGQIWGTNTVALQLAFKEMGFKTIDCGIARDNLNSTIQAFQRAIIDEECDMVISTGGVSVGDFDVVHTALAKLPNCTVTMDFWKVRMKPGKPVAAGIIQHEHKQIPLFALPGNPVSAFMGFYQFVRPFLLRHMGNPNPSLDTIDIVLGQDIHKRGSRLEFVRCWIKREDEKVLLFPTQNQSSAWMSSFSDATAILPIPADCNHIAAGEIVSAQLLPKSATWPATWRQ